MNADDIAKLIPQQGRMCLLEGVERWDANAIRCFSGTHRDPRNPLRARGRLPAVCGIEYAAQAMALHGALSGAPAGRPAAGYLASVRDLVCSVERLDGTASELVVEAEKWMADERHAIYRFALWLDGSRVVSGRAAVAFDAAQGARSAKPDREALS